MSRVLKAVAAQLDRPRVDPALLVEIAIEEEWLTVFAARFGLTLPELEQALGELDQGGR